MEYGALMPNSTCNFFPENATMEADHFIEELLLEGCWLETSSAFNFFPQPAIDSHYIPSQLDISNSSLLSINPNHQIYQQDHNTQIINNISDNYIQNHESFVVEGTEVGRRVWIGPRANPGPCSSVKERLILAIGYLKECVKDRDVLIQIWVPDKRGGRQILTTCDQPYTIDPNSKNMENYRDVSKAYKFLVEENSAESVGLPSRAFLGKLPEWTPDVGFFRSCEYPRIGYAQQYDVQESLALPIFERGSGTCLGIVEIVMTTQKINYRPELEYVCQALETVDLRSFQDFSLPTIKTCDELYQAALSEIVDVLTSVCKTHRLPLALTWAPCAQQGKGGWRHSDENYTNCVSTVDSACLVADAEILGFHEACSEYHLLRGQGIVGTAFSTSKPCFATDVTAFSMTEYPLSHHARMFSLCAAVAIPFRSVYTGSLDFVLEFFLPKNCQDIEEQKHMLNSLSIVIQQSCRSLQVVVGKELEEEIMLPTREAVLVEDGGLSKEEITQKFESTTEEQPLKESSWIAHMMEAQKQGKGISVSLNYQTEEVKEEFRVTTNWDNNYESLPNGQVFSEFGQLQQSSAARQSVEGGRDSYSFRGRRSSSSRKAGEKRRTKTEKSISLQVLRQYFAGSLKDAAKSIGVCPTTLKRICRQHGITRWPSRKIKKVGHSLRKLQLVIDSVQGTEGSIQIGSFYSSFPELNPPKFQGNGHLSSGNTSDHSRQLNDQQESGFFNHGNNTKSPSSSSSSQTSGSTVSANGRQQYSQNINAFNSGEALMIEDPIGIMKRACSEVEFCTSSQEETKLLPISQNYISLSDNRSFDILPPIPGSNSRNLQDGYAFRVKANLGNEKIRFSLPPNCSFRDLQQEIARRFNLDDISTVEIKYLDDDREWVLLKCNADLQECMEIYKSSQSSTIRLFLQRNSHPNQGNSYGSYSPS